MKNDLFNTEIDEIIRASMKLADEPDPELNSKLKASIVPKRSGRCESNPPRAVFLSGICR